MVELNLNVISPFSLLWPPVTIVCIFGLQMRPKLSDFNARYVFFLSFNSLACVGHFLGSIKRALHDKSWAKMTEGKKCIVSLYFNFQDYLFL